MFELSEESVVVFANKDVSVDVNEPVVGDFIGDGGAEVGVVVGGGVEGEEAKD